MREDFLRDFVRERFEQMARARGGELLHRLRDDEIIDRVFDAIAERAEIVRGLEREIQREPLRSGAFIVGNAEAGEEFELFDVDEIGHGDRREFGGGRYGVNARDLAD